ncbi:MAG: hypothetical protein GC186_03975 [Rhodobacteraceae bacterium]|nr:hypothetical protein [Paracoccaceae bacterium]
MSLATLATALSALGILVTGMLALTFLRDPAKGMAQTTHRLADLPKVMADRYVAFTALAVAATLYRDLKVIAFLFAVFAFMAFADAWIYLQGGHAIVKHLIAGIAAALVCAVALAALFQTGAAS